jgi:hypothetical protein
MKCLANPLWHHRESYRFHHIDFRETEASKVVLEVEVYETLQFERKKLAIPAGVLRQFVVGKYVGATFGVPF